MENYVGNTLDAMNETVNQVNAEVSIRIDKQFAEPLENDSSLRALQLRSMKSFSLLTLYRDGDAGALDALMQNDPGLGTYAKQGAQISPKELDAVEKELIQRLQNVQMMLAQLRPRIDAYYAEVRELDDVLRTVQDAIRKMRVALTLWSLSHVHLGAGIPVPPEIDLASMITDGAMNAVKTAVPIP